MNPLITALGQVNPFQSKEKVRTFDPKEVIMTFGPIVVSGYSDGTFISIEPDGDSFRIIKGVAGDVDRVKVGSGNCYLTLTLLQTSPSNDLLSTAYLMDMAGNAGVFPLIVKDLGGTQLFMSMKAFIITPPKVQFGNEIQMRDWRFFCPEALNYIGGNQVIFG